MTHTEIPGPAPTEPPDTPDRSRLRSVTFFGGLAIAGLTVGIIAGRVTGTGDQTAAQTLRASQAMATSTPTTVITSISPSPSPSPTTAKPKPKPTPKPTRSRPADYSPIPADATTEKDLDFGFLTAVQKNGDLVTITFDRATFSTGEDAKRANGGKAPDNDYLIGNTNPDVRTFTVSAKAPLIGMSRLIGVAGGPAVPQKLDAATFAQNASKSLATGLGIPVWVRHSGSEDGPVTSLAEQYIP